MSWGNCFAYAIWRHVTKGGWVHVRRSAYRFCPHFIWSETLPPDLPAKHFIPKKLGKPARIIFDGHVIDKVGDVLPPDSNGFDYALFIFWMSYFAGYLAIAAWIIYWIWS